MENCSAPAALSVPAASALAAKALAAEESLSAPLRWLGLPPFAVEPRPLDWRDGRWADAPPAVERLDAERADEPPCAEPSLEAEPPEEESLDEALPAAEPPEEVFFPWEESLAAAAAAFAGAEPASAVPPPDADAPLAAVRIELASREEVAADGVVALVALLAMEGIL
jgi:hypothetical protein